MPNKSKQISISEVEDSIARESSTVSMQGKLRQAIFDSINESDVAQIVAKQVEKAKQGDDAALQFVMKYVLGFGKPTTLQQINVITTDVATASKIARGGRA